MVPRDKKCAGTTNGGARNVIRGEIMVSRIKPPKSRKNDAKKPQE